MGVWVNIESGYSNLTLPGILQQVPYGSFLIAGGLQAHDSMWTTQGAHTINETRSDTILDHSRIVNIINYTTTTSYGPSFSLRTSYEFEYDQQTGIIVRFENSFNSTIQASSSGGTTSSEVDFETGMVDNNI